MNVFTVPMKLLTAVVLDEATDAVKKTLLSLGVLDFIQVSHLAPDQAYRLTKSTEGEDPQLHAQLRTRVETLFQQAGRTVFPSEKLDPKNSQPLDITGAKARLDKIGSDLGTIREQQKQLSQAKIRVEELFRYVADQKTQYIDIRVGSFEKEGAQVVDSRLANIAHVFLEPQEWKDSILLTLKRDRQQVTPLVENLRWTENPDGKRHHEAMMMLKADLEKRLGELESANNEIKRKIVARIEEEIDALEDLWCDLRLRELLGEISRNFSHTRNTTIFSGWVPKSASANLERAIRDASGGACVIEWTDAEQMPREEVPVAVPDIPLLRPFQKLVDNYSVPEYGTINPTPFVAVSYLAMFALMFADAGQGLAILLLGLFGSRKKPAFVGTKRPMIGPDMYRLFIYLGASSILSGILFGSYFGLPLFPPVWFDYHGAVVGHDAMGRNVYSILGITIWFGIVVIGTGLLLNWINLVHKRDWFHLVMDKNGIIGGWLFGCGAWAAFAFVGSGYKTLPEGVFLPLAFGIPLLILFAKVPLHRSMARKAGHEVEPKSFASLVMDSVMEWIVDVLEIFSGFLANTLSFMRVAGLGIAHVSLMTAFMQMAELAGGFYAPLILVLGNVMVIALEGLSAGIQALRLNYYEFFTKYFTGRGLSYDPIALHPHAGRQIR